MKEWKNTSELPMGKRVLFLLEEPFTDNTAVISGKGKKAGKYWELIPDIPIDKSKWTCNKWKELND